MESLKSGYLWAWKKCALWRSPLCRDSTQKRIYLSKINQEWVFEVNRFHMVKKGHAEWNEKCFYFKNKSNATTLKQKSKVNNTDILVDWNQLKYAVDFCFLFWSCKFSNFLVTVDNILWLHLKKNIYWFCSAFFK